MKNFKLKLNGPEKRTQKLESSPKSKKIVKTGPAKGSLTSDLDKLMQKHGKAYKGGIVFSGIAIPSDNPDRLVRWSGAGGFNNRKEFEEFLDKVTDKAVSLFCSSFSSPEKLLVIKALI
jgi:hypothetical protein